MPEHVHLLIFPVQEQYSISQILLDIKRPVAQQVLRFVKSNIPGFLLKMKDEQPNGKVKHRFWQRGGGYDRNMILDRAIYNTIAYIHANPVRRGLVQLPEDWYWSSAGFYFDHREGPLKPDVNNIPYQDNVIS